MYLFAIVEDKESKKYKLISEEIKPGTKYSLQFNNYCYGDNLDTPWTSSLPQVERDDTLVENRKMAYAMGEKSAELCDKYNVIAMSHRRGGWQNTHWVFGDSVSFDINTNFGYGHASYFDIVYKYKNLTLASFSHFIKYKNSTYASIMRCTRSFPLKYSWWEGLMNDCISFYNALVAKDKSYVFIWIEEQLSALCFGLEGFVEKQSWTFELGNDYGVSYYTEISGDDFWLLKAEKMVQSLHFINNIKKLPVEVDGGQYINRIIKACNKLHPLLKAKIKSVNNDLMCAEEKVNGLKSGLIEIYERELAFYPHRKYGIKKHVQNMIRGIDKWVSDIDSFYFYIYKMIARRKSQYDYIEQVNQKIKEIRTALLKKRSIQKFVEQLKKSEEQLSNNLKKYEMVLGDGKN